MHALLMWTLLAVGASPLPDGTPLFLENCNSVVEYTTRGEIGHVSLAFNEGGETWVYEATPGEVRRIALADYYAELARINRRRDDDEQVRVWALRPRQAYTVDEVAKMRAFLSDQLGRRYSVRGYVRTKPGDGIHCAELASTALNRSGRYGFENCEKIHPQALYAALKPGHMAPQELTIPALAKKEPWCARAQRRTGEWFTWCGWSCQEAWSWCW
ncbi:MAG: hypothetical protein WD872_06885 [Pirellulaceae bacterium]